VNVVADVLIPDARAADSAAVALRIVEPAACAAAVVLLNPLPPEATVRVFPLREPILMVSLSIVMQNAPLDGNPLPSATTIDVAPLLIELSSAVDRVVLP